MKSNTYLTFYLCSPPLVLPHHIAPQILYMQIKVQILCLIIVLFLHRYPNINRDVAWMRKNRTKTIIQTRSAAKS